jgi:DNA-binding response OmpR family regulator
MELQGKILTVDDDPNNIAIVEELLEDSYNLKTAASGREALEIARDFRPDIILLDIMMPDMSGYEVCRRLRERYTPQQTKIIMVSARAMDDYITKPFDGDEFLEKVHAHLCAKNNEQTNRIKDDIILTMIKAIN